MSPLINTDLSTIIEKFKKNKFICEMLSKTSFSQFKRYAVVGILSFCIEFTLFTVVFKVLSVHYIISNTTVYAFSFWFNFLLNRLWSFKSKNDVRKQLVKYAMLFIFNLTIQDVFMYLLKNVLSIDPVISKILIMILLVPWTFTMYKKVIYK